MGCRASRNARSLIATHQHSMRAEIATSQSVNGRYTTSLKELVNPE
jgi:hypothetical protein